MIPRRSARLLIGQMLWDLLYDGWQLYFDELSFPDAVVALIILVALFLAEADGKPLTRYTLARKIGMPIETARKHVQRLLDRGIVTRNAKFRLGLNVETMSAERSIAVSRRHQKLVIKTAAKLAKLGTPKMGG